MEILKSKVDWGKVSISILFEDIPGNFLLTDRRTIQGKVYVRSIIA